MYKPHSNRERAKKVTSLSQAVIESNALNEDGITWGLTLASSWLPAWPGRSQEERRREVEQIRRLITALMFESHQLPNQ